MVKGMLFGRYFQRTVEFTADCPGNWYAYTLQTLREEEWFDSPNRRRPKVSGSVKYYIFPAHSVLGKTSAKSMEIGRSY